MQNIGGSVLASLGVSVFFTLIFPVILVVVLKVRKKITLFPILMGVASFTVSQLFTRLPLISILSATEWWKTFSANTVLYVFVLSLTAGLFEESARLIFAVNMKKHQSAKDSLSFGIGHGLWESMTIVGLSVLSTFIVALLLNNGTLLQMKDTLGEGQYQTLVTQLTSLNEKTVFLGVLERLSSVIFHISASIIVFSGVVSKRYWFGFIALALHTVFNMLGVLLSNLSLELAESVLFLSSVFILTLAIHLRDISYPKEDEFSEENIENDENLIETKNDAAE